MAADWPADDATFIARLAEYADGDPKERKLLFDYGPLIFPRLVNLACSGHPGLRAGGLDALGRLIKLVGLGRMLVRALCSEAGLNSPAVDVQRECAVAISRVMQACSSLPDEDRDNIGWIRVLPHLVRLCAHPDTTPGAEQALQHLRVLLGPRSFHRRFTRALLAYHENLLERSLQIGEDGALDLETERKATDPDVADPDRHPDRATAALSWTLWPLVKEGPLDTSVDGLRALALAIAPHPRSARDILMTLLPMIESFDIEVSEAALTAAAAHFHRDSCWDIVSAHPMASAIAKERGDARLSQKKEKAPPAARIAGAGRPSEPSEPEIIQSLSSSSLSSSSTAPTGYLRKPSLDLSELGTARSGNPETISLPSKGTASCPTSSPKPASVFASAGSNMMKMTAQLSTLKRKTSGRKRLGSAASSDDLRPHSASGRSRLSARSSPLSASSARSVSSESARAASSALAAGAPRHELAVAAARGALHATTAAKVRDNLAGAAAADDDKYYSAAAESAGFPGVPDELEAAMYHQERETERQRHQRDGDPPRRGPRSLSATHPVKGDNSRRAIISRQRSAPVQGQGNEKGQGFGKNGRQTMPQLNIESSRSERAATSGAASLEGLNEYEPPPKLSARDSLPATVDGVVKLLLDDSQWQDQVRVLNAIKSNQHTSMLPPNCRSEAAVIQAVIKLTSSLRSSLSKSSLLCLHFLISDNGRAFWREQSTPLIDAVVGALIKRSIDASIFLAQEARSALDACVQSFPASKFCAALLHHCHAHPNARARANAACALHNVVQTTSSAAYDAGRVVACAKDKLLHDNSVEARAAAKGILMLLNEAQNLDRKQQLHLDRIGQSPLHKMQPVGRAPRGPRAQVQAQAVSTTGSLDLHADLVSGLRARDWQTRLAAARHLHDALASETHPGLFQLACESARDANVKVRGEAVKAIHGVASQYGPQLPAVQLSTLLLPVAAATGDRATQPLALACLRVYLKASPELPKVLRRHLASLPPKAKASLRPLLPAY